MFDGARWCSPALCKVMNAMPHRAGTIGPACSTAVESVFDEDVHGCLPVGCVKPVQESLVYSALGVYGVGPL